MFGGIGVFKQGAMFCQVISGRFYLRGGGKLDARLNSLSCVKYRQVKRQCTATVNYYDVTTLFLAGNPELSSLVRTSFTLAVEQKNCRQAGINLRIRDLPNMQLTIERMLKKSGIQDVDTFKDLGAHEVFEMVKGTYGNNVDPKLLWKLAGAIEGVHWKVLKENKASSHRVSPY